MGRSAATHATMPAHAPVPPQAPVARRAVLRRATAMTAMATLLPPFWTGCATLAPQPAATRLLDDSLFPAAATGPDVAGVLALSDAMREYARAELAGIEGLRDPRRALVDALYRKHKLQLDYDGAYTRNAAETFRDRAGNCLSLVLMTAAFAHHLGLPVSYQLVRVDEVLALNGDLQLASQHVNLVLGPRASRLSRDAIDAESLTVDFLPQIELQGQQTEPLSEATILAMYFNNRAAESLVAGRLPEAYAAAREAVRQDPHYLPGVNTLGVIYRRAGHLRHAEAAWRHVLALEPNQLGALVNATALLRQQGRDAEAAPWTARLARLQPVAPFELFRQGQAALARGDAATARDLFLRELRLQPFQDEVHFWAAQAYAQLGQAERAERHLQYAHDHSRTRNSQRRYAAKLERLRSPVTTRPL